MRKVGECATAADHQQAGQPADEAADPAAEAALDQGGKPKYNELRSRLRL